MAEHLLFVMVRILLSKKNVFFIILQSDYKLKTVIAKLFTKNYKQTSTLVKKMALESVDPSLKLWHLLIV